MSPAGEPRVLHVIANLEHGGAQEMLCTLAERRPVAAFFVCALADGPLRARLEAAAAGFAVVPAPRFRFHRPVRYAAELRRIERAVAELVGAWRADIVQTHLLNVLDAVVMRLRRAPGGPAVIWTFHGREFLPSRPGPTVRLRRAACRHLYRAMARSVDAIVAVSDPVRDALVRELGPAAAGARVIENAPDPEKSSARRTPDSVRAALGLGPGSRVVLYLGRLSPEKGCRHLIEAMPAVRARVPGAVALLAGEGPERAALEALAGRTDAAVVRFLGARAEVGDLLAAADVVCLPSLREGLSLALLEALAAGRPVVASDIVENRGVVEDGTDALLVPPGEPAALADALIALLTDTTRAAEMGRAGHTRSLARPSPERQARLFAALYDEVLAARNRR